MWSFLGVSSSVSLATEARAGMVGPGIRSNFLGPRLAALRRSSRSFGGCYRRRVEAKGASPGFPDSCWSGSEQNGYCPRAAIGGLTP